MHHKTPVSEGGTDEMENLVTVCTECHKELHGRAPVPTEQILEAVEQARLDGFEAVTGEFDPVGGDEFDAVVLGGVVRGGDRQPRDARRLAVGLQAGRREGAQAVDRDADAGEPAGGGVDELGIARRTAHNKLNALVERGELETRKIGARGRVWWVPIPAEAVSEAPTENSEAESGREPRRDAPGDARR